MTLFHVVFIQNLQSAHEKNLHTRIALKILCVIKAITNKCINLTIYEKSRRHTDMKKILDVICGFPLSTCSWLKYVFQETGNLLYLLIKD